MKSILIMAAGLFLASFAQSQANNSIVENVKINGDCLTCKAAIEKAGFERKIAKVDWDIESKTARITYDPNKTNIEVVLKRIALAGYDNQSFLAPDAAYDKLPDSCKYARTGKHAPISTHTANEKNAGNSTHHTPDLVDQTTPLQEANPLQDVFNQYFSVKDALVSSDGNLTSQKARDLLNSISAIKMEKLKGEIHTAWMKVLENLKQDAQHINATKDLDHQRDHFMSLSKNMYVLMKVVNPTEKIYYQFCPMANDGKGANWLSKDKEIKNPYYGSKMLSCGRNVETIE